MKRRKWTNEEKFKIVLEGLQNRTSVAELCNKHGIQQFANNTPLKVA